mmetsp:Transcript_10997/g.23061  ORF Transcript_10997/g.23061 Transcript_10997/m.23061 type:complete len:136 (-) Transcript_10997:383-790(-)
MHHTRKFDGHGGVEGEQGEVVVNEINHAMGGVHLSGKLSEYAREDDHSQSNIEENQLHSVGQAENIHFGIERVSALVNDEDDQENHELTAHQVAVQVVPPESKRGVLVRDRVGVFVEIRVDWWESDERSLLSLDH